MIKEEMKEISIKVIEKHQCKGCKYGSDTKCGMFQQTSDCCDNFACLNHSAELVVSGIGKIALGMPSGFNIVGALPEGEKSNIRIWDNSKVAELFDVLNLPVWYQEIEGNLFVRTYSPRMNYAYIDIFVGGKAKDIKVKSIGDLVEDFESKDEDFTPIDISSFSQSLV